jgi:hypothetical protein
MGKRKSQKERRPSMVGARWGAEGEREERERRVREGAVEVVWPHIGRGIWEGGIGRGESE